MAIVLPSLPAVSSDYGYTCQCWLKTQIDRICYVKPWIWFSTSFSAWSNVDSSNPCWLYLDLSRAVHQKDVGSRLIRDLKAQMLRSIGSSSLPAADAHNLKAHVTTVALAEFRSEVWRLDLNKISINRGKPLSVLKTDWRNNAQNEITKNPPQVLQSDEYLIQDLQQSGQNVEYEVIIEG